MKKVKIDVKPDASGKEESAKILIEGDLLLKNAIYLKDELITASNNYKNIDIELRNISAIDIAAIQILAALKLSIIRSNGQFSLISTLAPETKELITKAGFSKMFKTKTYRKRA